MEQLKAIESTLVSLVQSQLSDLQHTDAKELGEVVDMIKDLEEAMYYCAIVEAMEKSSEYHEPSEMRMGFREKWPHGEFDYETMDWEPYYYGRTMRSPRYYESGQGSMSSSNGQGSSQGGSSSSGSTSYYGGPNYYYHDNQEHVGKDIKQVTRYLDELNNELPKMLEKSSQEDKRVVSDKL